MLQTYQPEHPVLRAIMSGEERQFWRAEADERRLSGMPPFGRLAGVVISAPNERDAFDLGEHLARNAAPLAKIGAQVFGPAPAPVARVRGRHRVRLLVKAPKDAPLQAALRAWLKGLKLPNQLRLSVDIDPQSFY
jgi:primosomal protein N' (replication factor Y)